MAILINTNDTPKHVEPENGTDFQLKELYKLIGCDLIDIVRLPDDELIMVVDDECLLKEEPRINRTASLMAKTPLKGTVLLCRNGEVK